MEIERFRIENFRSIRDTKWQPLSCDNITILVGQNESGKSSILDALDTGYSLDPSIASDDFRIDSDLPRVYLSAKLDDSDINDLVQTQKAPFQDGLRQILKQHRDRFVVVARIVESHDGYAREVTYSDDFSALVRAHLESTNAGLAEDQQLSLPGLEESIAELLEELWRCVPEFVLFRESESSLPNRIDIKDQSLEDGPGNRGARNFLAASGLDLADALSGDHRKRDAIFRRASTTVTRELQSFWTQVLGRSEKISLDCELKHHAATEPGKAGMPYLAFWVKEGDQPLYPSQRSRGTRWYVSFFLELLAGVRDFPSRVLLLDEPATFLHPKAQGDVVRLLEKLSSDSKIVYSTHSPYMLDHQKLHRILAVERVDDNATGLESYSIVRRGLELATASRLTLAPILDLIGVDLSQQQIIKKTRNVLIEEISGLYYFQAFLKLLGSSAEVYFVPCGGVDAVRTLADLFIAWGLKFSVLVDDDSQGKKAIRDIKQKYAIDDETSRKILLTLSECDGVEDVFTKRDFLDFVLGTDASFDGKNSAYVKRDASKPMLALGFNKQVMNGDITLGKLEAETARRIGDCISKVIESVEAH